MTLGQRGFRAHSGEPQLDGAINAMIFDDRENILRKIEAAIAGAK